MKDEIEEENMLFDEYIKYYNFELKKLNGNEAIICNPLTKLKTKMYKTKNVNYKKIKELVIESIDCLGEDTKQYFQDIIPKSIIARSNSIENGHAEIVGNSNSQTIFLTKHRIKDIDLVAFSHEVGHIPTIKTGAKLDYFEYSEVLSMFIEYLTSLKIYNNGKDRFINTRLSITMDEANSFMEYNDGLFFEGPEYLKYVDNMKRNYFKYILSFDYVLQLIDIFEKDKKIVNDSIDSIICGYESFKDLESKIGIDTSNCKKLLKISEKYKK